MEPTNFFGFVYIIIDIEKNMGYIGKRKYWKIDGTPNEWKNYSGSSRLLDARLKESPSENFRCIVLEQYTDDGTLVWSENWSQCHVEIATNNDVWYNRFVDQTRKKPLGKISERHKATLTEWNNKLKR